MKLAACLIVFVSTAAAACSSCSSSRSGAANDGATDAAATDGGVEGDAAAADVELLSVFDLPRTGVTQGLSATWFDLAARRLYALQDIAASVTTLTPTDDFKSWSVGASLVLTGRPNPVWDGEGLGRTGDVFFAVTSETTPLVERFDTTGKYLGKVDVPARYAQQQPGNKGLESLSVSPSGKHLFFANEAALTTDGAFASATRGTKIRILRRDLASGADEERAYRTEPLGRGTGGDMGVSDVTAVTDDLLLVLERGYQTDFGNTVRIYRVDYASAPDVSSRDALDDSVPALPKTLVVDLATLPSQGVTNPGKQPNPILDNFEALALGPILPDGRHVVFVTSDDNAKATQVPRIVTLAVRLP